MDDFGALARDFGFRPQGKSAPMKSDGIGAGYRNRSQSSSPPFTSDENQIFNDVFGGPPKFTNSNNTRSTPVTSDIDYDSIFKNSMNSNETKSKSVSSNLPVYDKPVYDDDDDDDDSGDIFDGLPGIKSKPMHHSASSRYDDNIFASMSGSPSKQSQQNDHFDDLLGNLGRTAKVELPKHKTSKSPIGFDDLLHGFGSGDSVPSQRSNSESAPVSSDNTKKISNAIDDPFVVLESTSTPATSYQSIFIDPLEPIHKVSESRSTNVGGSSVNNNTFDDLDPLHGFSKPAPAFSCESNNKGKDQSPSKKDSRMGRSRSSTRTEPTEKSSFKSSVEDFQEFKQPVSDIPPVYKSSQGSVNRSTSPPSYTDSNHQDEHVQPVDDIWLTVSEIPLFTQPTSAPPPSRPPPPIPRHASKSGNGYFASNGRTFGNDYSASPKYSQNFNPFESEPKSTMASPLDEFENFALGENNDDSKYGEEMDSNSAAAAMKDAMDRAEAKFKHAKEVRERENAKAFRNKETVKPQKDMEEETNRKQREIEEQEREKRRIEREKARQAVERANREARERAAAEARERAAAEARLKAERAAVQRAQAEARERAAIDARERAERAAAEARERASSEASEREAREKAAWEKADVAKAEADARRKAERAAVERVNAEARERAAASARDRAAAAAKMNQQKNDNDLDSFFSSRASSAPRPRTTSSDPAPDTSSQRTSTTGGSSNITNIVDDINSILRAARSTGGFSNTSKTYSTTNIVDDINSISRAARSTGGSSNIRKTSSTSNIVDDLNSIFGAAPSSAGGFQEVEGETEERRRARLERQQRTQERAAKALEEKNNRDLQSQREQEERHRIGETLDIEIKRWAAGKEGNLRALLSTLQYVLWPGCGWQAVSLTDLMTGANVKKAYRKATLCIHPDKVQQKGANLQQKYVAEKVFDLLKEAWNKFNSEELF
ncbi:auxilin-related protein 1-like isoform X2 [Rutidosis leptorrhynchoides]|uniref:auxilin-related protein 1-like isoform X2 n=1 Tax=Rutidosis leptorrhynchoides TaxID=125765 RepID=UPI003A99D3BB